MPLKSKSLSDFINNALGKFQIILTGVDPNQFASLIRTNSVASGVAGYSLQDGLQDAVNQMFPQTADDEFLALHGSYNDCNQNDATSSSGTVIASGILGNASGVSLVYNSSNGIVTATVISTAGLTTNSNVIIAGVAASLYNISLVLNGIFTITVTSLTSFTYTIAAGLSLPSVYTGSYILSPIGTLIPEGSVLNYTTNGYSVPFMTTGEAQIQQLQLNFTTAAVVNNNFATASVSSTNGLATGVTINISGCSQPDLNGDVVVTVISDTEFTYPISANSYSSDSGSMVAYLATLNVTAELSGQNTNVDPGSILIFSPPITNITTNTYVTLNGLEGGADAESQDDYRSRVLLANNLTPGIATVPMEVFSAKKIPGNTRIFVIRAQSSADGGGTGIPGTPGYVPASGETMIYIIRDNDNNIFPNINILMQTYNQLISDGLWPSFLPSGQLYIVAPIPYPINFKFTPTGNIAISATMQQAVANQLPIFFQENSFIQWSIINFQNTGYYSALIAYNLLQSFLYNIQDPTTGDFFNGFTFTMTDQFGISITPSGPNNNYIIIGSGELAYSGNILF